MRNALVLLSGGLDSICALHWAEANYDDVLAVFFDYGQPARSMELAAADAVCNRHDIELLQVNVMGALTTLSPGEHWHIPGRNALLLASAAAIAARTWPGEDNSLVIGCNSDDAMWHVDCQPRFLEAMASALSLPIEAPLIALSKAGVVACSREHGDSLRYECSLSWSCYGAGPEPCGQCPACELRGAAERTIGALA